MKRLVVVLLMAGCGADADGPWNGSIETLPNGAVRVTNPAEGIWEVDAGWRLVPELVLGTVDGPEQTVFASVSGIEVDDSGRIYVLDRQANELRIFLADGTHVRSVGRSGAGPGEYAAANGLRWISQDTLVLVDQRGNRYSILTSEGEYVRSVPRALGFYGWSFNGGYRRDTLYEFTTVGREDAARPALLGTSLRSAADASALVMSSDPEAPGRQRDGRHGLSAAGQRSVVRVVQRTERARRDGHGRAVYAAARLSHRRGRRHLARPRERVPDLSLVVFR
jgi:hypothetical protein